MNGFFRRWCVIVFLGVFTASCLVPADAEARSRRKRKVHAARPRAAGPYVVSAKAALLMDMASGKMLYANDINRKILPASTTKILTAILVLERMNLEDYVTISDKAAAVLPSKIYAEAGDKYQVKDLLYAALLNSANDASLALAEAVAGSEDKFADMMNERARSIGAQHTLFANPHGLPDDDPQFSTAYDMSLIFREAMKKPFFREAIQSKYKKIVSFKGKVTLLRSHNKILFMDWKKDIYGKTGYTQAARACFVGYFTRGDKNLIVSVFGCSKRWDDIKYIVERIGGVDL